jgi:hypothetical protein
MLRYDLSMPATPRCSTRSLLIDDSAALLSPSPLPLLGAACEFQSENVRLSRAAASAQVGALEAGDCVSTLYPNLSHILSLAPAPAPPLDEVDDVARTLTHERFY